ncbi:2OG-Fe(II) oxygenase [Emticicia agri]|uniref:Prolyl 4-hydroxylase subunit alpha n=1 Tax=Emticicia agri TaxID=2492393 RepID=A0A4Q5M0G1_9BACT|nr:2OG-Fe(II) oxygenase [Emticicia agri]RYU95664.1 prolyl 4-hydroxylase subunit alpha [Emticicia agri]
MSATITQHIENLDWSLHTESLNKKGYAVLPEILSDQQCKQLATSYNDNTLYRSTIDMKRYQFGSGEYKYFKYPLPDIITQLRQSIYPYLAAIANDWMSKLSIQQRFPEQLEALLEKCHQAGQIRPTPLILKYHTGDWNALHQDLYGKVYFPFQIVFFLTQAQVDYTGGELVMVENRPRMQSKPIVLQPDRGEAVIFTTNFRPVLGAKGYYRTSMRHGVSEVRSGERINLGIIFHDAQ